MSDTHVTILVAVLCVMVASVSSVLWTVVSVCRTYKDDPSYPSLVLSYIWSDRKWYASIVRYTEKWGKGKVVVMNVTSNYLLVTLARLVLGWLGSISVKRVDQKSRPTRPRSFDFVPDDAADFEAERLASLFKGFKN